MDAKTQIVTFAAAALTGLLVNRNKHNFMYYTMNQEHRDELKKKGIETVEDYISLKAWEQAVSMMHTRSLIPQSTGQR